MSKAFDIICHEGLLFKLVDVYKRQVLTILDVCYQTNNLQLSGHIGTEAVNQFYVQVIKLTIYRHQLNVVMNSTYDTVVFFEQILSSITGYYFVILMSHASVNVRKIYLVK